MHAQLPVAIEAGVTPWSEIPRTTRSQIVVDEDWQGKVRRYDRDGPGIVGAALDMPAATAMLVDLTIEEYSSTGQWERVEDDPFLTALLHQYRGDTMDQRELFARLVRVLDGPGEGYHILHRHGTRMWWQLAHTTNLHDQRNGTAVVRTRRGARRGSPSYYEVRDEQIWHFHQADLEYEDEAWSPMRRGLPHIEDYRATMRNISRNVDSQLAMNGVMWSKSTGEEQDWPDKFKAWASKAIQSDQGIEAVIPFPMVTPEPPQWIDVGRGDHEDQIMAAELHLKAFARSTDLPTNMLLEGPGQANHWNAYLEGDFYADMTMAPRLRRAAQVVTECHLRPFLEALSRQGYRPDRYRIGVDDTRIRTKTDNTDRVLQLEQAGVLRRRAAAEAVGASPDDLLPLPDGVSEWESWMARAGRAAQTSATVSGLPAAEKSGNQIVPGVVAEEPERPVESTPDYWLELTPT